MKKIAFLTALVVSLIAVKAWAMKLEHINQGPVSGLPFSEAVIAGDIIYLSGKLGVVPGSKTVVAGGITAESKQAMENIKSLLASQNGSMDDVIKCTVFLADIAEWPAFNEVYKTYFSAGKYPARSAVAVSGLGLNGRVEVECMAKAK